MRLSVGILSLLMLVACGGGGDTPEESISSSGAGEQGEPRGVLVLEEYAGIYRLDAWFTRVPEAVSSGTLLWQDGEQHCRKEAEPAFSSGATATTALRAGTLWQQTLFAGEALEIRDRVGVVTRMPAQTIGKAVLYATDERWLEGALPEDAYLLIPGAADFPAFESVSLPPLASLHISKPDNGVLSGAGDTIEWQASSDDDDEIELMASLFDEATTVSATIICTLEDSGRFLLPAALRDAVPETVTQIRVSLQRRRSTVHEAAGASLTISQSSRPW